MPTVKDTRLKQTINSNKTNYEGEIKPVSVESLFNKTDVSAKNPFTIFSSSNDELIVGAVTSTNLFSFDVISKHNTQTIQVMGKIKNAILLPSSDILYAFKEIKVGKMNLVSMSVACMVNGDVC